jgi:hypothetical protein
MGPSTAQWPEARGLVSDVSNATPMVVTLKDAHGFKDQDEVQIAGVEGNPAANGSFFAKVTGHDARSFGLFLDKKLRRAAAASGVYQQGGTVYEPFFKEDYAIVVGINRYPAFPKLQGPETDATLFHDWLISPTGGMMRSENAKLILSSKFEPESGDPFYARPALTDFTNEFDRLRALAYEATSPQYRVGRRLYLFLSGHGITPAGAPSPNLDDAALLMANASSNALNNSLPGHPYAEWFRNAGAFDEIVLLMDCCRNLENNVFPNGPTPALVNAERKDQVRRFYAAATELDAASWEQELGSPKAPHGVFSFVLMQGLQDEAVCDSEGRLSGSRLKEHIETSIKDIRPDQVARIYPPPERDNEIVFVKKRRVFKPNLKVLFGAGMTGKIVKLVDGANYHAPPEPHQITGEPWELKKPSGFYKLEVDGGPSKGPWELKGSQEMMRVDFP